MLRIKQQLTSGWNVFLREEKVSLMKRNEDGHQQAKLKKTLQNFVKLCKKIFGWLSGAYRSKWTSTEKVRKILTEILTWGRCVQKWSQRSSPKNKSKEEFLATKQITVLEHPAYSPDLAPNDFFLFLKIKEVLKGRHFDDIRSNTMAALKAIPQNQFQNLLKGGLGTGTGA